MRSSLGQSSAVRLHNLAPATELAPSLLADAVSREQIDAILSRPGTRDELRLRPGCQREVGRVRDHVRPAKGEGTGHLREPKVIADLDSDPAEAGLVTRYLCP